MTDWLIESIEAANSIERLRFLAWVIKQDQQAGEEWTADEKYMERVRESWIKKKNQLT